LRNKRCHNCTYAVKPGNDTGGLRICTNKAGSPGRLFLIKPYGRCRNHRKVCKMTKRGTLAQPPGDDVRFIPLTQGKFAIVDAADYEELSKYNWYANRINGGTFYALRPGGPTIVMMHRQIMKPPKDMVVHHIDGNGLNNRRSNLIICTQAQNSYNARPKRNCSSKYKGVHLNKTCKHKKWAATIKCKARGGREFLGRFEDQMEAARVYDRRARELFGQFAYLNFPEEQTEK